jgi:magnesium-transporting ATPase (P-type)
MTEPLIVKDPMTSRQRRLVGCYLIVFGALLVAVAPWVWAMAWSANESGTVTSHFFGAEFTASAASTLVAMVALMALIGSVTVMILVFAARAGHGTLEQAYLWWYLTRPVSAAGLGILLYMLVVAGFFNIGSIEGGSEGALVVAAALGGLSGLFTDQVVDKVRAGLGLRPFDRGTARRSADDDAGLAILDDARRAE